MDAKAGFISAMNAGLLTFLWTGAKLTSAGGWAYGLSIGATAFALISLLLSLWIVVPRVDLQKVFGKDSGYAPEYEPVSFYAHVAKTYTPSRWAQYKGKVDGMSEHDLAEEALEQHFTISHVLYRKHVWLTRAGTTLLIAVLLCGLALFAKEFF